MKKLKPTGQYKKDYKRFRNTPKKVEKLFKILELLQNESDTRRKSSASIDGRLRRAHGMSYRR